MARLELIKRMGPEFEALLARLVRDGWTIQQIRDEFERLGKPVSNGAMGRSVKKMRELLARRREVESVATAWVREAGEKPGGDVSVMLAETLQLLIHHTMDQMGDQSLPSDAEPAAGKPIKAMDLMLISKALQNLESVLKQSMDRRERIEKAVLQRAAAAATTAAKRMGATDAFCDMVTAQILGVGQAEAP